MIKCPHCGKGDSFTIVTDGLWSDERFSWDKVKKNYHLDNTTYDGCGDQYIECGGCGQELRDSKFVSKFWEQIEK